MHHFACDHTIELNDLAVRLCNGNELLRRIFVAAQTHQRLVTHYFIGSKLDLRLIEHTQIVVCNRFFQQRGNIVLVLLSYAHVIFIEDHFTTRAGGLSLADRQIDTSHHLLDRHTTFTIKHTDTRAHRNRTLPYLSRRTQHAFHFIKWRRAALQIDIEPKQEIAPVRAHQENAIDAIEALGQGLHDHIGSFNTMQLIEIVQIEQRHLKDRTHTLRGIACSIGSEPLHVRHIGKTIGVESSLERVTLCNNFCHFIGSSSIS